MKDLERRAFVADELRVARSADAAPRLTGHAAIFNTLSQDLGGFREQIRPGAFAQTVTEDDIRALFNHNPDHVLGRNVAKTLRLLEDAQGLAIEMDLPDTQLARDLATSIDRGDITQMSFGFRVKPNGQEWSDTDQGLVRTLTAVRLFDVSPVTYPAYLLTDVAVRSLDAWRAEHPAAAVILRAQGEARQRHLRLREFGRT